MAIPTSHIMFSKLVDLADSRLSAGEIDELNAHLFTCPECSELEQRLRRVVGLMRTDDCESAPPFAISNVMSMLERTRQAAPSVFRRILAALKFDSLDVSMAYGVRGEAESQRQLLFEAGENQLHLQVSDSGRGWVITGQVLGAPSPGEVELTGESGSVRALLDEQCEFALPPVGHGRFSMLVRLKDVELEVPELKLGL